MSNKHTPRLATEETALPARPGAVSFHAGGMRADMKQRSIEISTEQMLADLKATYPTLWTKPLSEFGAAWVGSEGVWTGVDGDEMPDGMPIFMTASPDPDFYDGIVNHGFVRWLEERGWDYELYDGATIHLRPQSAFM